MPLWNPTSDSDIPRIWVSGVHKITVKEADLSAVVSGGLAVFYLTDDGTSGGNVIFNNVYLQSINLLAASASNSFMYSNLTLSGDNKSLTVTVNQLGTILLGIIQIVSAANGVVVYLQIKGD